MNNRRSELINETKELTSYLKLILKSNDNANDIIVEYAKVIFELKKDLSIKIIENDYKDLEIQELKLKKDIKRKLFYIIILGSIVLNLTSIAINYFKWGKKWN